MKAIIVARVSTEEQREANNSLPAQLKRMQDYCERNGYIVIETFSFDESAYKTKRDEFDRIIKCISTSKEKVAVCFDKVDRLSRNIFDKRVAFLYEKAVSNEIELHFVSDSQIINDNMNAGDKFAFGMKLGLSKYYSDAISDNVKRAFEHKRRNGEWTGKVRIGYLNIALDAEKRLRKDIVIDPLRGHLVRRIFELYVTGNHSYESIRIEMTNLGLRSLDGNILSKSNIELIIRDSFYCGIAISKYGKYLHRYPKLISRELYDKCQEIRLGRSNNRNKVVSKDFVFKGIAKCANCGCSMSAETKVKPSGKSYTYYSCTNAKKICKKVYVRENDLLKPVYDVLERFEIISEEVQADLVAELRKTTEAEVAFHKAQLDRIRDDYEETKQRDNRLLDAFLDQSITKDLYDTKHQEYADKLQLLEIELSEYRKADFDYQTTVATVISVARRARSIFEQSSDVAGKRAFLNYLLQNPVVSGKELTFSLKSPFNLVLDLATATEKAEALTPASSGIIYVLRDQDSNLEPTR